MTETVARLAMDAALRHGDRVALRHDGADLTYAEGAERVVSIARGLLAAGLGPGDRIAIWSANRPEWVLADLAAAAIGATVVPIYSTSSAEEAAFILGDTAARVVVCDEPEQAAALAAERSRLPALEQIVAIGDRWGHRAWAGSAVTLAHLTACGAGVAAKRVYALASAVRPGDVYRIIYTSGTTGPPKGCPLTHANVVASVSMRAAADPVGPDERFFLFLPLAHAYGLAVQLLALTHGAATIHATGSMDELLDQLAVERPTILLAVPRFVQKLHARVTRGHAPETVEDAIAVAEAGGPADRLAAYDRELFAGVRAATGGNLRRAVVGAAPVATDTLRLFRAAGVLVVQGYGMTETSGFAALSTPDDYRFGAVGRPLPGMEVRIAPGDGEILLRGPNVFGGYVSGDGADFGGIEDGWLHTGDVGRLGDDGLLEVTGRLKNLIVTAGGKNIAPENLERDLLRSPWIDQAVVCGDGRPYPVALIVVDDGAVGDGDASALVEEAVDAVNAAYSRPERIKAFALLVEPLTVAAGELTPSMKVRRGVVEERYAGLIDALYAKPAPA